jgi:CO dehydrogenase maturation factor
MSGLLKDTIELIGVLTMTNRSDSLGVSDHPLSGRRLGILGKGGAGKSTVSVLLSNELAERGYDVFLLDSDSTNVGLHRALGIQDAPRSLLEFFGGMVFSGGLVTCPVDDPTPLAGAQVTVGELPPPYIRTSSGKVHLLSGGKLGDLGPGAGCDGPISKIARDLMIRGETDREVLVVDLKAGMEDLTRGVIANLDWVIVVVDPSFPAVQMAESIGRMVSLVKGGALPATEHLESGEQVKQAEELYRNARVRGVLAVLNRVGDIATKETLADRVSRFETVKTIGALCEDPAIGRAWFEGHSLGSPENRDSVRGMVDLIETAEVPWLEHIPVTG